MNKYFYIVLMLLTCSIGNAQVKISIDDIILVQKDDHKIELKIPKTGLNTGDCNKIKRIALYENSLIEVKTKNGGREIISDPIFLLEGFCNSSKSTFDTELDIHADEYFLEVTYIFSDFSKKVQTKSLVVSRR